MTMWLFATTLCVLLLVHNGGLSGLDGETFYQVAKSVVDHQRLDVGRGFNTHDGRRWPRVRQVQRRSAAARRGSFTS